MRDVTHLSLGDLVGLLIEDRLIDACQFTADRVELIQDTERLVFPPEKARTFLLGMLRGRSWNDVDGDARLGTEPVFAGANMNATASLPPPTLAPSFRPAQLTPVPKPALIQGSSPPQDAYQPAGSVTFSLDELLAISRRLGIIDYFEKRSGTQSVLLRIPECSCTLSFEDAAAFLADCIRQELRPVWQKLG